MSEGVICSEYGSSRLGWLLPLAGLVSANLICAAAATSATAAATVTSAAVPVSVPVTAVPASAAAATVPAAAARPVQEHDQTRDSKEFNQNREGLNQMSHELAECKFLRELDSRYSCLAQRNVPVPTGTQHVDSVTTESTNRDQTAGWLHMEHDALERVLPITTAY